MVPLSYETMDYASPFASSDCAEGIVGISSHTLRIITPERLGEMFNQTVIPLRYSPRKMSISMHKFLVITESSQHMYNYDENLRMKQEIYKDHPEVLALSEQ